MPLLPDWFSPEPIVWRFVFGALGAVAPEILRVYRIFTVSSSEPLPRFGRGYFLISILFLFMGGTLACGWGEENLIKCFYIGVTVPAIISSAASQLKDKS